MYLNGELRGDDALLAGAAAIMILEALAGRRIGLLDAAIFQLQRSDDTEAGATTQTRFSAALGGAGAGTLRVDDITGFTSGCLRAVASGVPLAVAASAAEGVLENLKLDLSNVAQAGNLLRELVPRLRPSHSLALSVRGNVSTAEQATDICANLSLLMDRLPSCSLVVQKPSSVPLAVRSDTLRVLDLCLWIELDKLELRIEHAPNLAHIRVYRTTRSEAAWLVPRLTMHPRLPALRLLDLGIINEPSDRGRSPLLPPAALEHVVEQLRQALEAAGGPIDDIAAERCWRVGVCQLQPGPDDDPDSEPEMVIRAERA